MLIGYKWLQEFVELNWDPTETARVLTFLGLEAEVKKDWPEFYQSIVVGEILEVRPHPQADRLSLCSVTIGDEVPLSIVCGAPNVAKGQKVPVALPGTTLPHGLKLKKTRIRGQLSEGMLCSEKELGISSDHSGIMILDPEAQVGRNFLEYLLDGETSLELDLTPNRADAWSHIGVARDLVALTGQTLKRPEIKLRESQPETAEWVKVQLTAPEGCPRYVARIVRNVVIKPSPYWLQARLRAAGLRPINNVVDAANYILLETGHPMHTFDYDRLAGKTIEVRWGRDGETLTTLDGEERQLSPEILLICDGEKPVALAGIMGGANSEVTEQTRNILIECAYFDPVSIRRGSKKLQLSTEASKRFERGVDPNGLLFAIDRLTGLIQELAGGEVLAGRIDEYPRPIEPARILFRPERCRALLGVEVSDSDMERYLTGLECKLVKQDAGVWEVEVPTFRPDLTREVDLIEEVARLYGYEKIPMPAATTLPNRFLPEPPVIERERITDFLVGRGYSQVVSNSLVPLDAHPTIWSPSPKPVELANPLTREMATLRTSLWFGLASAARHNQRRRRLSMRLFEMGYVSRADAQLDTGAREELHLGLLLAGEYLAKQWLTPQWPASLYHLKGDLTALLERFVPGQALITPVEHEWLKPALELSLNGEFLGIMGRVVPRMAREADLNGDIFYAELKVDVLLAVAAGQQRKFKPLVPFPVVERDLSIVLPANVSCAEVEANIRENGGKILKYSKLYDLYQGKPIAQGQKSFTFRLVFQRSDRTLTEEEVEEVFRRILKSLNKAFGATLREGNR